MDNDPEEFAPTPPSAGEEAFVNDRRQSARRGEGERRQENLPPTVLRAFRRSRRKIDRRQCEERRRSMWVCRAELGLTAIRHWFPVWQAVVLIFFVAVVFIPAFLPMPPENASPWDNFTVFSNYAMWGLWFPLVLLSVIVTGRSWCGLFCPQGAAAEWMSDIGLHRTPPAWMRWQGTPIASFLFVTVLGQTIGVRDHPEAIAELFGGTLIAAMIVGSIYGHRTRVWCRHLCPIGLLLGIFSRLGMVHFGHSKPLPGGERYVEKGICPTLIEPRHKTESRHCIVCFRCVNPHIRERMVMTIRPPGREVARIHQFNPNLFETLFLFLGTGIALGGFLWLALPAFQDFRAVIGEWFFRREMYWVGESGPAWLMSVHPEGGEVFNWLDFMSIVSFMVGFMALLTGLLIFTTWLAARLAVWRGAQRTVKQSFIELGYQYAPVAMISLVLGLGTELFKVFTWFGLGRPEIGVIKFTIFSFAFFWSVALGERILMAQGVAASWRWLPMLPSIAGSMVIGLSWSKALF